MDLSFLIPSATRRQVLEYFIFSPDTQVHVNELARTLGRAPQLIYRELINLENWGFLFSAKRGNQRVFRVNKRFVFFKPMAEMFSSYREEQNRSYQIVATYNLKDMIKRQKNTPVPKELIPGLTSQRTRPRSYDEEILLQGRPNARKPSN